MIIYVASGHSAKHESSVTVYKMEQQQLSTPIKISAAKCLLELLVVCGILE